MNRSKPERGGVGQHRATHEILSMNVLPVPSSVSHKHLRDAGGGLAMNLVLPYLKK